MTAKIKISMLVWLLAATTVIAAMTDYHLPTITRPRQGVVTGVLYSDKPAAVIDHKIVHEGNVIHGVKVVKIHKDKVEFEKHRKRWTQRVDEQPNSAWPKSWFALDMH